MMGFGGILTTIALGTKLTRAVVGLKKQIDKLRSGPPVENVASSAIDELDRRTSGLEALARRQAARINELEIGIEDAAEVTEALARRVGTVFWIALASGTAASIALIFSVVAMAQAR